MPMSPSPAQSTTQPLPQELKEAILARHIEWLEANEAALETSDATLADMIEVDLEKLEKQATMLHAEEFHAWKFWKGGYGTYTSHNDTLVGFGGLDILKASLGKMRKGDELDEEDIEEQTGRAVQKTLDEGWETSMEDMDSTQDSEGSEHSDTSRG